jgi:hypothetical protein
MIRYKSLIVVAFLMLTLAMQAQELRCNVSVVSPSVQGTNKKVYETMQTALNEFMNNQRWTDKIYANEERIECNFMINIKEVISIDEFKGTLQIQARRPVFNSAYNTVLFNFQDQNFHVKYVEFEPLVYNPSSFESNLVGIMAYYAYIIIGMDEDSYSLYGGASSFQKAEQIVSRAQNVSQAGWKSFENQRNRYWMTENLLNEYHKPLRECLYRYHRLGLDRMAEKVETGRSEIASSLELLRKVYRQKPGSFLLQVFFNAKTDELINIFSESFAMEKSNVAALLQEVDPSNIDKYKTLTSRK